jgi:SAM-dependent methyltransferase
MPILAAIDQPVAGSINDPLALQIEGWLYAGDQHAELEAIEIRCDGRLVGQTSILLPRPDVVRVHRLTPGTLTGFALLACAPELFERASVQLQCWARFRDGTSIAATAREIRLIGHDHRENHYGVLARPDELRLFHRSDIYTSGASVSEINPDCLALIRRYLGPPLGRVLDVGCGFGGYGRALLAEGYDWFGVEVKASDCVELARLGLPHQHVDGSSLPFADASFDATICVEVLEHIAEPGPFLTEIQRVTQRRFLLSVPNVELIPYLHRYAVVPWHLLEGDHKNFFTRPSLRNLLGAYFRNVEVLSYAPIPLRTPEGLALHNHLFAICDV